MGETTPDFKNIIEQIKVDASPDRRIAAEDDDLLESSEKNSAEDNDPQYTRRNKLYSDLLELYIEEYENKSKWKKGYKLAFFVVVMFCFFGIIGASLYAIIIVAQKDDPSLYDLGTIIGSVAGIISSLVVLPKIIAEHLFPTDEDRNMNDILKSMQENDSAIRNYFKKK